MYSIAVKYTDGSCLPLGFAKRLEDLAQGCLEHMRRYVPEGDFINKIELHDNEVRIFIRHRDRVNWVKESIFRYEIGNMEHLHEAYMIDQLR